MEMTLGKALALARLQRECNFRIVDQVRSNREREFKEGGAHNLAGWL